MAGSSFLKWMRISLKFFINFFFYKLKIKNETYNHFAHNVYFKELLFTTKQLSNQVSFEF